MIIFKNLFCEHEYKIISCKQREEYGTRIAYAIIKCVHCGKERKVDSQLLIEDILT